MSSERYGLHTPPQARRPVPWYAPAGLRGIAQQQLWSLKLLQHLDRRETFQTPMAATDLRGLADADGDFWFDFLADTGDGGCATYAVARGVLTPQLHAQGALRPLPEGRLLLLGGDLAYPGASPELYQARLVEPFELARDRGSRYVDTARGTPHDAPFQPHEKLVAAIPQNHDWFDSASTFCRYFVHHEKAGLIGARAPQSRTYFAFSLPHGWHLLGFDVALSGDLDRLQFEAFCALIQSGGIPRGAPLILVYPEPWWTRPLHAQQRSAYPTRIQRLEHLIAQAGLCVRLRLAGDLHHYVRERLHDAPPCGQSSDLVTCGSGGAFGHATHTRDVSEPKVLQWASEPAAAQAELRGRLLIGRVADAAAADGLGLRFGADRAAAGSSSSSSHSGSGSDGPAAVWPDPATSRAQARGLFTALLRPRGESWHRSNLAFSMLIGALLLVGALGLLGSTHGGPAAWLLALLRSPWALGAHLGLAVTGLFLATDNDPARGSRRERVAGALLGGALWLLCAGGARVADALLRATRPVAGWADAAHALRDGQALEALLQGPRAAGLLLLGWLLATVAAGLMLGAGLYLLSRVAGLAVTNVSSPLSLQGHKGFLRLRVHADGVEAWMLGCDDVPTAWEPVPGARPETRPYWQPAAGQPPLRWHVVDHFEMRR
ncbi:MAG: hypothetical protein RL223_3732 [Pseudomonadota bacterium]|jgi:hypothetical protein